MGRQLVPFVLGAVVCLAGCGRTEGDHSTGPAGERDGVLASAVLDGTGGQLAYGPVVLTVPQGALSRPVVITLRQRPQPPRGAVGPVWEFGPEGLNFIVPARLALSYDPELLPVGVDPLSLRLSFWDGGRWKSIDRPEDRGAEDRVSAAIPHFSTYGLVPEPRTVSMTGMHFEANGVVAETSDSVVGRLFVSPSNITFFAERDVAEIVTLEIAGLPTDDDSYIYLNSYSEVHVLPAAAGGVIRLNLDLRQPAVAWVQPRPGTWRVVAPPGSGDDCAAMGGTRAGDTCTLGADVTGSIELVSGTLDCAAHRIAGSPAAMGIQQAGIGVFIGANAASAVVRRCAIGGPGMGFAQGVYALADDVRIEENQFEDNQLGVLFQGADRGRVAKNGFSGASLWAVAAWESAADNEIVENYFAVDADAIAVEGPHNLPSGSHGNIIRANQVTRATGGILLVATRANAVSENDISGVLTAIVLGVDAWPNRVWWNNFSGWRRWGVWSDIGPAELSDAGRGNWWGKSCGDPLFTPGADGSREDITDSHAYSARSAWVAGGTPGCPPDTDGDAIPEDLDNCPGVANYFQENVDGVAEGDACDTTAPAVPVIETPTEGEYIPGRIPFFTGTAEPGSKVIVQQCAVPASCAGCPETCREAGFFLANAEGNFVGPAIFLPAPGAQRIFASTTDAAGNESPPSPAVQFTFGVPQVDRPVISAPADGAILSAVPVAVAGWAPRLSRVVLRDSGIPVGETVAADDGAFAFAWSALDGDHAVTAIAHLPDGSVSAPSELVTITVRAVTTANPFIGEKGKARIVALDDNPDPMSPLGAGAQLAATVSVDRVNGLGGGSANFRFEARLTWTVADPSTGGWLATSIAEAELLGGPGGGGEPVVADVAAAWDGRDEAGATVALDVTYPYSVQVEVIREYVGPGRGPRCSRDESIATTGAGSSACLVDRVVASNAGTLTVSLPQHPLEDVDPTSQPKLIAADPGPIVPTPPSSDVVGAVDDVSAEVSRRWSEISALPPNDRADLIEDLIDAALGDLPPGGAP
jgi:parallel beta-helix repeat protein